MPKQTGWPESPGMYEITFPMAGSFVARWDGSAFRFKTRSGIPVTYWGCVMAPSYIKWQKVEVPDGV